MEKLFEWKKKQDKKAKEIINFLTGESPGVDYLWELADEGPVPVVILLRLPLPGEWHSRALLKVTIEFMKLLGGACRMQGDKQVANMFFMFCTVIEIALDKDKEERLKQEKESKDVD